MAQIKHIAIATQDAEKTAQFYREVFGLREVAKLDGENAKGFFLSDGNINLAILDFQNDQVAGAEHGMGYSGIHHIGFQVDDLETASSKLTTANGVSLTKPETVDTSSAAPRPSRAEMKWAGPDGQTLDISVPGWLYK